MIKRFILSGLLMQSLVLAEWEPLAPMPEPNGGFACAVLNGKLIVAGGTNWKDDTKHWLDVIWSYDPATNKWSSIGRLPNPCAYAASGVIDNRLVIAGGSDGKTALKDILAVKPDGQCGKEGELPGGRVFSASAVLNNDLWLAGGATDPAELKTLTPTVYRVSFGDVPVKVSIEPAAGSTGFGIGTAAMAWKRVFVFGGAQFDPEDQVKNLDEIRVLNAKDPQAVLPFAIRGLSALALSEHHIYLAGGYPGDAQGFSDQAWIFLATSGRLVPAKSLPIKAMVHLISGDGWAYCLGGEDQKKHRSDKMWRIRLEELLAPVITP